MNFQEYKNISQSGKEGKIKTGSFIYRFERMISAVLSFWLIKTFKNIKPNHISISNFFILSLALILLFLENENNLYLILILQLCLIILSAIFDKMDGEIARFKKDYTQKGIYFDLLYHFYYPLVLFFSFGAFFEKLMANNYILMLSLFAGILHSIYVALRKSRHHIKYKIFLEKNEHRINDLIVHKGTKKRQLLPFRIIDYFIFQIYDYTVFALFFLAIFSMEFKVASFYLYIAYIFTSIIFLLYMIIFKYPNKSLYTKEEFFG